MLSPKHMVHHQLLVADEVGVHNPLLGDVSLVRTVKELKPGCLELLAKVLPIVDLVARPLVAIVKVVGAVLPNVNSPIVKALRKVKPVVIAIVGKEWSCLGASPRLDNAIVHLVNLLLVKVWFH